MDASAIILLALSVLVALILLKLYHKYFTVYYGSFFHNILSELFGALALGFIIVCLVINFVATHFRLVIIAAIVIAGLVFYWKKNKQD